MCRERFFGQFFGPTHRSSFLQLKCAGNGANPSCCIKCSILNKDLHQFLMIFEVISSKDHQEDHQCICNFFIQNSLFYWSKSLQTCVRMRNGHKATISSSFLQREKKKKNLASPGFEPMSPFRCIDRCVGCIDWCIGTHRLLTSVHSPVQRGLSC